MSVSRFRRALHRIGLRSSIGDARFDFADALADIVSAQAEHAVRRINVARSLHDLWHFRPEIFTLVSRQHDQAEATRRLDALQKHAPGPPRRAGRLTVDTANMPY